MLSTTVYTLVVAYFVVAMFGMNEEVRRIDPKFAMESRDCAICFAVVIVQGALGAACLYAGTRARKGFESSRS